MTSQVISLKKVSEDVVISLQKKGVTNIPKDINVSLVLDQSGSMSNYFGNGTVANILRHLLGISNVIDDDGNLPFVVYHSQAFDAGTLNVSQYDQVEHILGESIRKYGFGGTAYTPAIDAILKKLGGGGFLGGLFGNPLASIKGKQLITFITDGETSSSDEREFEAKIKQIESSNNVYVQLICVGFHSNFLSSLGDRYDSVGYSSIADFSKTDAELIDAVVNPEVIAKFG
ncbi:putative von Willebrand A domain protein [Acinetobacter phage vB_AbaM_ME3]|uniref:Putative von Willebrand A domain protein n=1 Tax=Acinetobacter phage vB_AbaM_ME3 TaxID=1837876 RepID=A0A172Q0S3_9CAUD|nr:putative von Willebrand A domain protein [Acinetobacter phage vB_AbaM_ME3]AND75454.1 putative von Willebrand A domain protein [Acinetobacter phage vB_AbaM_ME3]